VLRELEEGEFEAFDELSHEREIKSIDRVAGKVIVRIAEEGGICVTMTAGSSASQNEA
jgi:hypothetical protein